MSRRVQHYGYRYDYGARTLDPDIPCEPLPAWLRGLGERLLGRAFFERLPDQAIVNEYLPTGQGIAFHVDSPAFGPSVASLSCLSPCVVDLRRLDTGEQHALLLEPRSLLMLGGEARTLWQHGIARRKSDRLGDRRIERRRRLSITFRTRRTESPMG